MIWVLLSIVSALVFLVILDRSVSDKEFDKIPGPKGLFIVENSFQFLMDPVRLFYYFRELCFNYKQLFKIKLGTKRFLIVHNPEDVETLISGTKNLRKGFLYRFIEPWLHEGLLMSDGKKWHQRRKILTPAFHFNILRHFRSVIEDNSRELVKRLETEISEEKTDVTKHINDFTLTTICETAMGTKLDPSASSEGRRYVDAIHTLGQLIVFRSQRFWIYANWLFSLTGIGRKQKKLLELLSSFRDSVINKRRENNNNDNFIIADDSADEIYGKKRLAMLDLLLKAERDGIIDAKGIGEEVDTFMFEGHDTTSTALQFAFMLLANNEKAQEKVFDECRNIFGESERSATQTDLSQMKYLECCIKESLRLYPPVAFIMRYTDQINKLKNYEIPEEVDIAILIYDMHRREDQFVKPLEFMPERFQVEPTWHSYAYIPFSAGPRNCIGQKFAMMEMKLVLSTVLRSYRMLPVTRPEDVVFVTDFILRPKHPIYVKFEKRNR